ncbi:RNA 2',3'-cyclic phosphodiesterase [Blastopirellula marina]|uniref:RNA 2',3'-cyclic phosphodiesterase n=1 Tax=Blastopirellula marina TaxID=124 RepID=A0A2S8FSG2_9BACT|nr:RNA 2',3'-cyclic phosphodiesterase [Blastopirellula marina]PQO35119.1 RNA 2',3'-cyclic phosphodiesterase [Blastopirellula marina]PTL43868.1 RNA 2',3'-cyclic phosphodiesterase [Blastopirellula marina]
MNVTRCFIAMAVTDEVKRRAQNLINILAASEADVKWVETHNMHITLSFLGDVTPEETVEISRAAMRGAEKVSSFDFTIAGPGAFPDIERPRTLWLGLSQGAEQFCQMQSAIAEELAAIGYPETARKFHPHLSLGRIKRPTPQLKNLTELLKEYADYEAGVSPAMEASIYASQLERRGPKYTLIGHAELG